MNIETFSRRRLGWTTRARTLLAALVAAVALLGATAPHDDDDNGSRVCLGSMGMVACVPPA